MTNDNYYDACWELYGLPAVLNVGLGMVCALYSLFVRWFFGFYPDWLIVAMGCFMFTVIEYRLVNDLIRATTVIARLPPRPEIDMVVLFGWLLTLPLGCLSAYMTWIRGVAIGSISD